MLVVASQLARFLDDLPDDPVEEERELTSTHVDLDALAYSVIGESSAESPEGLDAVREAAEQPAVARLVSKILLDGLREGADGIHLQPRADGLLFALRLHGELRTRWVFDKRVALRVTAHVRMLAQLDPLCRDQAEEGLFVVRLGARRCAVRLSSLPNAFGESLVLSFRERGGSIDLEALGFLEPDAKAIGRLMMHPFGYVFVVGPADSARDGTLAGMLDRVRDRGLHVVAIEARGLPPSAGVNQIPVEPGTDMDYADALGHVLQHDPDVILVGNSSRPATAILGLQAALMGKLVLTAGVGSTAVEAIAWLMDAGTPTYVLAPALLGVVAQRRVPAICDSCRRQIPTSRLLEQQLEAAGVQIRGPFFEAKGCKTCGESGRKGQVMLYELLLSDARLRGAIHRGASREELQRVAIAGGMKPRCQHALHLAQQGVVSASTLEQELALWLAVGVPTS